jgi:hypothetical protein
MGHLTQRYLTERESVTLLFTAIIEQAERDARLPPKRSHANRVCSPSSDVEPAYKCLNKEHWLYFLYPAFPNTTSGWFPLSKYPTRRAAYDAVRACHHSKVKFFADAVVVDNYGYQPHDAKECAIEFLDYIRGHAQRIDQIDPLDAMYLVYDASGHKWEVE